jgi:hypothetical protein
MRLRALAPWLLLAALLPALVSFQAFHSHHDGEACHATHAGDDGGLCHRSLHHAGALEGPACQHPLHFDAQHDECACSKFVVSRPLCVVDAWQESVSHDQRLELVRPDYYHFLAPGFSKGHPGRGPPMG